MKPEFKDYYRIIGLNIAYYREWVDFSQEQLADKLGVDQSHLSRIENARIGISLDMLFRVADALEIEPYQLLKFRD